MHLRKIIFICFLNIIIFSSCVFGTVEWFIYRVDFATNAGRGSSIATDNNNRPHISYWDESTDALKYASFEGSAWLIQTVDAVGSNPNVGTTSIAIDSNNRPHISYRDPVTTDLKYASWEGTKWSIQTVEASGSVEIGRAHV